MPFPKPSEVRRSFGSDSNIITRRPVLHQPAQKHEKRIQRTNFWSGGKLDYLFLERCKECICRIKHPTGYMKHRETDYRLSVLPWSRGSYVDIRQYKKGSPTSVGILLHLDVIIALLPELVAVVHRLEAEDTREQEQKANIEVIPA